jgi:hypothetical protein
VDIRRTDELEFRNATQTLARRTQDKWNFGTVHDSDLVALCSVDGDHAIEALLSGCKTPVANDLIYAPFCCPCGCVEQIFVVVVVVVVVVNAPPFINPRSPSLAQLSISRRA